MTQISATSFWTTTLFAGKSAVKDYFRPLTLIVQWLSAFWRAVRNISQLDRNSRIISREDREWIEVCGKEIGTLQATLNWHISRSAEPLMQECLRSRQQLSALGRQIEDLKREHSQNLLSLQRRVDELNYLLIEFRKQSEDRSRKTTRRGEWPYDLVDFAGNSLRGISLPRLQEPRALLVRQTEKQVAMVKYDALVQSYWGVPESLVGIVEIQNGGNAEHLAGAVSMFRLRSVAAHRRPMLLSPAQVREGLEKLGLTEEAITYLVLSYQALWPLRMRNAEHSW